MKTRLRYVESALKYPTAAIMTWEVVAVTTGRIPSVTEVTAKHRWLVPVFAGLTAWHLAAWPTPPEVAA